MASKRFSVLIIVDMQVDFCKNGALAVPGADALIAGINSILGSYDYVIATQDWHPANHSSFASQHPGKKPFENIMLPYGTQTLWPDHCVQNTGGAQLHPQLDQSQIHAIIRKGYHQHIDSYSAFFENDHHTPTLLASLLPQNAQITLCGVARNYCVAYTYEDAKNLGYDVCVQEELCALMRE